MEICSHLIDESQIIGIGPLMKEQKKDPIYPTVRYYFALHCRSVSIQIESDAIVKGEFNPQLDKDVEYLTKFKTDYEESRKIIAEWLTAKSLKGI